ncbi:MAG: acyl-homoserine-lactone acylase [Oceanospirillaceae bacterium]|jgi:acyl-homoserine-lactone acylase
MQSKVLLLTTCLLSALNSFSQESTDLINPEDVTIVRDKWGVPHIYGKTDAQVAYGLAWANAEDDFFTMQELMISSKMKSGRVWAEEGAQRDFFVHSIGVRDRAEQDLHTISAEHMAYLEGYCQGVNAFAKSHKKEVRARGLFPIKPIDVVTGYMFALSAISYAQGSVSNIVSGKYDEEEELPYGSNAFAFNSNSTADGSSMICINPHQPMEGPFSWYEAHLCSEEGLNIHGAMFPGGTSIFLGNNENLGWAHTFNHLDLVDVFELEMHPKKKHTYLYNGEWKQLEKRPVWLKVKIKKWLPVIPVRKMTYWSEVGATIESKDGSFYAVKFGANEKVRVGEQWYRMNKAKNFTEFYDAVSIGSVARFNILYADKNDTVFFINNALMPTRNPSVDYSGVVPCNSDSTCWSGFHTPDELVQVTNPKCGWVFNANCNPAHATAKEEWGTLDDYPEYYGWGVDKGENHRSKRFLELMDEPASEKITYDRMKEMKFDYEFPECTNFMNSIENLFAATFEDHPEVKPLMEAINKWDRIAHKESVGAAAYLITFQKMWKILGYGDGAFKGTVSIADSVYLESLIWAKQQIDEHYNGVIPVLGEVQRHVRADVDLPLSGFPDALAANYNQDHKNGRYKPYVADSYVHFAQWPEDGGPVKIETLHPFGASSRPESPHYTDQMQMYADQETKTMTLDRDEIFKSAERVYHPGE